MKKNFALVLAIMLCMMTVSAFAETMPYPDYHDYSQFPIVEDGSVTITVGRGKLDGYAIDADQTWFWTFAQKASGINMEFEEVLISARNERKTLMFASGDLPDVMIDFGFTTEELVRYGINEGQLLVLNDFITPEIMPNLCAWIESYPEILTAITAPDGSIYSLPLLMSMGDKVEIANQFQMAVKNTVLYELTDPIPETLQEFSDMLYKMKALYPDSNPMGGGAAEASVDPRDFILNALGYLTTTANNIGVDVAVRNGKAVIPAGDDDFLDYLTTLNQWYVDEIISPDFFTLNAIAVNAKVAEGTFFTHPTAVFTAVPEMEQFLQWGYIGPLTSEKNDVKQCLQNGAVRVGGAVLSAEAKHAEEIMRWLDFYFSSLGGTYMYGGPRMGSPDTLDMISGYVHNVDAGNFTYHPVDDGYENNYAYFNSIFGGMSSTFGNRSHPLELEAQGGTGMVQFLAYNQTGILKPRSCDVLNAFDFGTISLLQNVMPYMTSGFPTVTYFDAEVAERINEIRSVLEPYIDNQVAKFITGVRDLSEFEAYRAELRDLGYDEYQKYYADYYESYLSQ